MGDFRLEGFKPWIVRIRKVCMLTWKQIKNIFLEIMINNVAYVQEWGQRVILLLQCILQPSGCHPFKF